jgi:hypothetical protein
MRSTPPPDLPIGRGASIRTCFVSRKLSIPWSEEWNETLTRGII